MITRLVILWLLSEQPLHGYRIKRILADASLRYWFPLETGSIYAVLRTLATAGHIETEVVEREGLRPERTQFRITKAGRVHFQDLLRKAWREPGRSSDTFHLALAARSELEETEVRDLLAQRAEALRARLEELERVAASAPAPEMVERTRLLTQAELTWIESLIAGTDGEGTSR
ncbi:MAG: PadR family transcriptional regulator [Fimbriimonas sp.]